MRQTIAIVEPHADDAVLSLGSLMVNTPPRTPIRVITVFPISGLRKTEAYSLTKYFPNVQPCCLTGFSDIDYGAFWKGRGNFPLKYHEVVTAFNRANGFRCADPMLTLENAIEGLLGDARTVYLPCGCMHPAHFLLSFLAFKGKNNRYYREFPHGYKTRNMHSVILPNMSRFKLIEKIPYHPLKWRIFAKAYPSQARMLNDDRRYFAVSPYEEIYEKRGV